MKYLTNKTLLSVVSTILLSWFSISAINAQQNISIDDFKGKWVIIPEKSEFSFKTTTIWVIPVSGNMDGLNGEINFDKKNSNGFVNLSLKTSSLNTGNDKRDEHLRSEDFFFVSKYPMIKFSGNSIELKDANSQTYNVQGNLTIRDVTEEETIPVKLIGYTNNSKTRIKFTGSTKIDRNKYNVDYSGRMIADKATIKYTIIFEKNK